MTQNEKYYYRKERGLCVHCGTVLPHRWGWTLCATCRDTQRKAQKSWRRRMLEEENAEKPNKAKSIIPAKSLDEMSVESKEKHLTYGQLQAAETIKRMRGES